MGTTGWIILGVIVLVVVYLIFLYNRLVALRQTVEPGLVGHLGPAQAAPRPGAEPRRDGEGLRHPRARRRSKPWSQARNAAVAAHGPAAQAQAENMLTGALRQLFALSEAYPDLKANQNFLQLQSRACRPREQDRRRRAASSTTPSRNTTPASSSSRPCSSPATWASSRASSSSSTRPSAPRSRRRRRSSSEPSAGDRRRIARLTPCRATASAPTSGTTG